MGTCGASGVPGERTERCQTRSRTVAPLQLDCPFRTRCDTQSAALASVRIRHEGAFVTMYERPESLKWREAGSLLWAQSANSQHVEWTGGHARSFGLTARRVDVRHHDTRRKFAAVEGAVEGGLHGFIFRNRLVLSWSDVIARRILWAGPENDWTGCQSSLGARTRDLIQSMS